MRHAGPLAWMRRDAGPLQYTGTGLQVTQPSAPRGHRQCPHPLPPCPPTYANAKNLKPSTHSGRVSEAFTASSLRGQNRALLLWGLPPRQTVLSPPDPGHHGCPVSGVAWSVGPRATSRWQPTPWLSVPAPHMCPQPD